MAEEQRNFDTKEFDLPETIYIRDVENRVFQGIVLEVLEKIDGISLVEGNFIDNILGRSPTEALKGIYPEQDYKSHSVGIKVEVNIAYGVSIPAKAEEIQTKVAEEITKITGLHVSYVHVVFKNMIPSDEIKSAMESRPFSLDSIPEEEYTEEF